jgi:peptide chain release factor 3
VRLDDPLRAKQLGRALEDMAEEGVTQLFRPVTGMQAIIGVVGQLQLDVLEARLASEYSIAAGFEPTIYALARWVSSEDPKELKKFADRMRGSLAEDRDDAPVFLAQSQWDLDRAAKDFPAVRFANTRERS